MARKIADAIPRGRLVVTGAVTAADVTGPMGARSYECNLEDGTGQLKLVFLGRRGVPGIVPGTRCTVEGTARTEGGRLAVWNPLYRIETDDQ